MDSFYCFSVGYKFRKKLYKFPILKIILPKIVPPLQGDKVTEPLMSELVRYNNSNPLLVGSTGFSRIIQQVRFSRIRNMFI